MLNNWPESFELVLSSEGGFVSNPSDPGGMTNLGVTQRTWEDWTGRRANEYEMRHLTPEKVEPLYKARYWDACRCDELPVGLDYLVFDFAVHAGPRRSIKTLQTALGEDSYETTMDAVMNSDYDELIERFSQAKEQYYRGLPTFRTFGRGWLRRLAEVKLDATSMLG